MVPKNLFAGQQWRNRHRKQIYGHGVRGEGEMYAESNMETYITICEIDSQWEFAVGSGNSNRGPVSTWWWGNGVGNRRKVQEGGNQPHLWLIHVEV